MTHATPELNRRAEKAAASRCARCGRALKREGTVTPLGIVGPECEQYVAAALLHLQRNGLTELALTGEMRLKAVPTDHGTWTAPSDTQEIMVNADRVGVRLGMKFDPATKEIVLVLHRETVRSLLSRQGMKA